MATLGRRQVGALGSLSGGRRGQVQNFRGGTSTIPGRRSFSRRPKPRERALDRARALRFGDTEHPGPFLPQEPRFPRRLRRGGGTRRAGPPEARDRRRGRRTPGRVGPARGAGRRAPADSEEGQGGGRAPARATLGPAALTRLRGAPAPSPPPPHTKAPARRARPDEEAAPPAAARVSIRRAARRAGPGRPRRPARSAPRRPGGGSAPRRSVAAPRPGGTGSAVRGALSRRAWRGPPRGLGRPQLGAGTARRPPRAVVGRFQPPHLSLGFFRSADPPGGGPLPPPPAGARRSRKPDPNSKLLAKLGSPPLLSALAPPDVGAPRAPGPSVPAPLLSPCG